MLGCVSVVCDFIVYRYNARKTPDTGEAVNTPARAAQIVQAM